MNLFSKGIRFFKQDTFLKGSLVLIIFSSLGNFFAYLYQFAMGKMLPVSHFGILNSLFSMLVIVLIPSNSICMVIARTISVKSDDPKFIKNAIWLISKYVLIFDLLFFMGFSLCLPLFRAYLKLNEYSSIVLVGLIIVLSFMIPIGTGILQGFKRFLVLGIASSLFCTIRFITAIILVLIQPHYFYALLAALISAVLTVAILYWILRQHFKGFHWRLADGVEDIKAIKDSLKTEFKDFYLVIITNIFFSALIYSDIIFVNHFFTKEESGIYAAAAILGRVVLYLSMPVATAFFPIVTENYQTDLKKASTLLYKALIVCAGLSIICIAFLTFFPDFIIKVLFDVKYIQAIPLLKYIGIAMGLYCLINVLLQAFVARKRYMLIWILLAGFALQTILVYTFHVSLIAIAYIWICSAALIFLGLFFYYVFTIGREHRVPLTKGLD